MVQYISPQIKVIEIATRGHILTGSLGGSTSSNDWNDGSESYYGFGDED